MVSRVSNIGVQNVGIFDVDAGRVEGARGSFMIDENLLPKLRFIKEGAGEIEKVDVFKVLRLLLAAHDENPDRTLYAQIRLTASFVDETILGRGLAP